jgi:hypothetical protein
MPNLDSTGKFGRSMDCSQLLEFKKKYKTVQQQNKKTPQGDQSQKPAFNSNRLGGGGSENGASWYYNQRGNTLIYDRFFGNRSLTNSIDPRISEYAALANKILASSGQPTYVSVVITALTANSLTINIKTSNGLPASSTFTLTTTIPSPLVNVSTYYLNDTGSPVTVTNSVGKTRTYSNGQFFEDDAFLIDQ